MAQPKAGKKCNKCKCKHNYGCLSCGCTCDWKKNIPCPCCKASDKQLTA